MTNKQENDKIICHLAYRYGEMLADHDCNPELSYENVLLDVCLQLMRLGAYEPDDSGNLQRRYKHYFDAGYNGDAFTNDPNATQELKAVRITVI